jgi:hypothetical protein
LSVVAGTPGGRALAAFLLGRFRRPDGVRLGAVVPVRHAEHALRALTALGASVVEVGPVGGVGPVGPVGGVIPTDRVHMDDPSRSEGVLCSASC